jgi:hydroxymethylbilane synthase
VSEPGLRIGTRGSALAMAQSATVAEALGGAELIPIKTSGDEGGPEHGGGDKSRFVREIERALLDGEIDIAVHSAKDLPIDLPEGLELVGVPPRELPADVWVGDATSLEQVPDGARVGTASLRRRSQLLALRSDLDVLPVRGNVDTRIRKLAAGEFDGIVLAAAGMRRLGRTEEIAFALGPRELTPAAGQGALALEARAGDRAAQAAAVAITNPLALIELTAERAVVRGMDADCDTPLGVCTVRAGEELGMIGYAGTPDGSRWIRESVLGDPGQPVAVAEALIDRLDAAGAREILGGNTD